MFWSYINGINSSLVNLVQLYSSEISLAFVATCLVLFGDTINAFVRRRVIKLFFLLRIFTFILLCAVGYGLLTVTIHPIVHKLFLQVPSDYSFLFTAFCFICLGFLAERKKILWVFLEKFCWNLSAIQRLRNKFEYFIFNCTWGGASCFTISTAQYSVYRCW